MIREKAGENHVWLCRNEHIVGWILRGAQWQLARPWEIDRAARNARGSLVLERRRAGAIVQREFADPDELKRWSNAGGFFGEGE